MNRHQRTIILWATFGLALLCAILGWLWMMQGMMENDAALAESRIRKAEERSLQEIATRFAEISSEQLSEQASGQWSSGGHQESELSHPEWPELEINSSQQMLELEKAGNLPPWGLLQDGRDWRGSMILKLIRKEGDASPFQEMLNDFAASNHSQLNPAFSLLLIKELEKTTPSESLSDLKLQLRIRASEGKIGELEEELESISRDEVTYFYTKNKLEALFGEHDVILSAVSPPERGFVQIPQFTQWPYLSFVSEDESLRSAIRYNSKLRWLGGWLTGLLVLLLVFAAFVMSRKELKRARARTDLAAGVAHELRTPLAGQRVILESLVKRLPQEENYLSMALLENERLSELSEEFLTFSRLERGILELSSKPCDLNEILEPLVVGFREQWQEDTLLLENGKGLVMGDPAGIATIARNFIENAWKYSEGPRHINVKIFENGFSVSDQGIGLSKKDQQKIFQQFYRVDQGLARSNDGLGLGLAIVKRLLEGMNGELVIESELGKGSTFIVKFQSGGES